MKTKLTHKMKLAALAVSLAAFAPAAFAQLTIPYADGSDGPLNLTNDTVIDLSQAVTGVWTNTSGNSGKGIYDPTQWAVVFKYSSVNIASGATVTFSKAAFETLPRLSVTEYAVCVSPEKPASGVNNTVPPG